MVQNDKKISLSCSISQGWYIIWFSFMILMFKMIIPAAVFFSFFSKLWFSKLLGRYKVKNNLKWQKIMLFSISQETDIIWSSFVGHKCKMIISPGVFFLIFFKILIFWVVRRAKRWKWPKMTKSSVVCTLYLRDHTSYDLELWCTCVKG